MSPANPKIIHYCWFGGSALSSKTREIIMNWQDLMSNYEIVRWDESNFDLNACPFVRNANKAKRWAFVSDYARFKIIYEYGGIYMDVGSILLKSLDQLTNRGGFSARDCEAHVVSPGLVLASCPHSEVIGEMLSVYESIDYEDNTEFLYTHTVNLMFARVLERFGYKSGEDVLWEHNGFTVYPSEFFCPKLGFGGFKTTARTYSIHIGSASWAPKDEHFRVNLINKLAPYTGDFIARKTSRLLTIAKYRKNS